MTVTTKTMTLLATLGLAACGGGTPSSFSAEDQALRSFAATEGDLSTFLADGGTVSSRAGTAKGIQLRFDGGTTNLSEAAVAIALNDNGELTATLNGQSYAFRSRDRIIEDDGTTYGYEFRADDGSTFSVFHFGGELDELLRGDGAYGTIVSVAADLGPEGDTLYNRSIAAVGTETMDADLRALSGTATFGGFGRVDLYPAEDFINSGTSRNALRGDVTMTADFDAGEIAQAEELGVRLIWPLRPGLLDSQAKVRSARDHLALSVDGLIATLQQVVGQPAPVLAFVSSGAVAVRAAAAAPDLISSISFVATCYSAGRSTVSIPYVGAELVELALRSEAIMTRTIAGLRKYVAADTRFRRMFEHTMRASARDVSHLAAEFDGPDRGERLRMVSLQSPESIKHDFFNQTQFSWAELTALTTPRQFLQGADDSIHPPHKLAAILERHGEAPLTTSEVMGHLPHFSDLRRSIRFALSEPDGVAAASDLPA